MLKGKIAAEAPFSCFPLHNSSNLQLRMSNALLLHHLLLACNIHVAYQHDLQASTFFLASCQQVFYMVAIASVLQVEPENYPDKKDALIGEFRNYLKILRAVHSGADLQASAEAAGGSLPGNAKGYLGYVLSHQQDNQILPLIENGVEARTELQQGIKGNRFDFC